MAQISLHVSPSPPRYFRPIATLVCLAFSGQALTSWWSSEPEGSVFPTPDDIPRRRLQRRTRIAAHTELDPDTVVVTALVDDQIAGVAVWKTPKRAWKKETLIELLYRKFIELKDNLEDRICPSTWYRKDLKQEYFKALAQHRERFLGPESDSDMWYLNLIAVHPTFQRKGVGTALIEWSFGQARAHRERIYLESTDVAKQFYIKMGFKELGSIELGGGEVLLSCMIWSPIQSE